VLFAMWARAPVPRPPAKPRPCNALIISRVFLRSVCCSRRLTTSPVGPLETVKAASSVGADQSFRQLRRQPSASRCCGVPDAAQSRITPDLMVNLLAVQSRVSRAVLGARRAVSSPRRARRLPRRAAARAGYPRRHDDAPALDAGPITTRDSFCSSASSACSPPFSAPEAAGRGAPPARGRAH